MLQGSLAIGCTNFLDWRRGSHTQNRIGIVVSIHNNNNNNSGVASFSDCYGILLVTHTKYKLEAIFWASTFVCLLACFFLIGAYPSLTAAREALGSVPAIVKTFKGRTSKSQAIVCSRSRLLCIVSYSYGYKKYNHCCTCIILYSIIHLYRWPCVDLDLDDVSQYR